VRLFPKVEAIPSRGSQVTPGQIADTKEPLTRAVEGSFQIGLVVLLLGACLVIVRPSLPLAWGVIVSVSVYAESRVTATRRRLG
jgi:hypothetical protein